jgi:type II secretory pathway pseudopilin PulG
MFQPRPDREVRPGEGGFGMVELLIALVLFGFLYVLAAPVASKMIRRARVFGALASIRQVFAVARLQAIRRGANVVVIASRTPEGHIRLLTFQDRANDNAALLPADEQAAAGNCIQDAGTFATSPASDEPTLGDVTIEAAVRLWKQGGTADDLGDGMSFDGYLGDATVADRVVFLPNGGILPPQDPSNSALPTTSGGRGIYFSDWNGQNFLRVTVDSDLTGRIRSDKYQDGQGYVGSGWTWQ